MNDVSIEFAMCWAQKNAEQYACPIEFGAKAAMVGLAFGLVAGSQQGEVTAEWKALLSELPEALQSKLQAVLPSIRPAHGLVDQPKTHQVDV